MATEPLDRCGHAPERKRLLGWSCEREKGHDGMHRHVNYVWETGDERATYCPVPVRNSEGKMTYGR